LGDIGRACLVAVLDLIF